MDEWFLWLTPVALLVLLLPFVFIGCGNLLGLDEDVVPEVQLIFEPQLQEHDHPIVQTRRPIVAVTAKWVLRGQGRPDLTIERFLMSSHQPPPPPPGQPPAPLSAIDPDIDSGIVLELSPADKAGRTSIACRCVLTFDQGTPFTTAEATMAFVDGQSHPFTLQRGSKDFGVPGFRKTPPFVTVANSVNN